MSDVLDVLVVGGGLSGLLALRALRGHRALLLEGRSRLGGRVYTVSDEGSGHYDLGPAWFWPPHREVFQLAEELKIPYFQQYEDGEAIYEHSGKVRKIANPQADSVSFRLQGGTGSLIRRLEAELPTEQLLLGHRVVSLTEKEGVVEVRAESNGQEERFRARSVVVTSPPRLAMQLSYAPPLPEELWRAMRRTPTWMGNAMKVVVGYDVPPGTPPFWRKKRLAGYAISEGGPCQQIHDHCSGEGGSMLRHALFGWVDEDDPVKKLPKEERRERVLQQFARLFGEEAKTKVLFYDEHDWKADPYTRHPDEPEERLRHHPRYGEDALRQPALNGKVFFAGTETATRHGGFLAGAIHSGREVAKLVKDFLS